MNQNYYAGIWTRVCAFLIDLFVVLLFISMIKFSLHKHNPIFTNAFSVGFYLFYFTILEAQFKGSFGKHAMGIVLVDAETLSHITLGQAFGRWAMGVISAVVFFIGFISTNEKKQGWHDRAVGTLVVRKEFLKKLQGEEGILEVA